MNRVMRKIRRWSKRSKLLAVEDENIEAWLDSLGILHTVKNGGMECFVCKKTLNIDSIQLISRMGGEVVLVCERPECVYRFSQDYGKS